jgi:hypothetical protein
MEEQRQFPPSAMPYLNASTHSSWERVQDLWSAPKRFESTALYERLGVLLVKKYAPTGGDFVECTRPSAAWRHGNYVVGVFRNTRVATTFSTKAIAHETLDVSDQAIYVSPL